MSVDIEPHITAKYEIRRRIGKGAYGIVWKGVDRRTGEIVALKKIFDAFTNPTDAQRTYREIMFLQAFSSHENVIQLLNVIKAHNDEDIYLVFEFMDTDLHAAIKAKILQPIHHQYIMYQLFKVMKYIHSGNCIHRDLKPSNILVNSECFIKLADFGLARSLSSLPQSGDGENNVNPAMTDYVATRWYRAPEILLGSQRYTRGVDMWSLGCILAEMIASKPLFAGTSTMNQIDKIMSCVPHPSRTDVESLHSPYAQPILDQLTRRRRTPLVSLLSGASDESLDLLSRLLQFNPDKRITSNQAIKHPYVIRFHNPKEEPVLDSNVAPHLDDNIQLSIGQYRDKLYESIVQKREELRALIRPHQSEDGKRGEEEEEEEAVREEEGVKASPSLHSNTAVIPSPHTKPPSSHKAPLVRHKSAPSHSQHATSSSELARRKDSSPLGPSKPRPFSSAIHPSHSILTRTHSSIEPSKQQQPDLTITSARIIPSARPTAVKHKRAARGIPSRFSSGTYTQTHGTISQSNLSLLQTKNW